LQAAREDVEQSGDFRETDDLLPREIGHGGLSEKGQEVVLAQGVKLDLFHEDHLLIPFRVENGPVHHFGEVRVVPRGEKSHGLGHAVGRPLQTLPLGFLA
jgi:hypothetical protein